MCRLFATTRVTARILGVPTLSSIAASLHKAMGGDGMGVALSYGKSVSVTKGRSMTSIECARAMVGGKGRTGYVLFHTRLSSQGDVSDSNCHPFLVRDGEAIAHNGHDMAYASLARPHESDTACYARLVSIGGVESIINAPTGVVIGVDSDGLWVNKTYGSLYLARYEDLWVLISQKVDALKDWAYMRIRNGLALDVPDALQEEVYKAPQAYKRVGYRRDTERDMAFYERVWGGLDDDFGPISSSDKPIK